MNRRTFIIILLIAAVASISYAIYRSVEHKVVLNGPAGQSVYGEPQHGLLLGLCVFAASCLIGAVLLIMDKDVVDAVREIEKPATPVTRRIL